MSIPAVHWALSQRTGSSSRKAVLKCIAEWMIGEKAVDCYPTVEQIAFETELNRKTVMDATRALEKAGFIKKRRACNKKLQWETHYTLVGYEPSEWIGSRRPECRTFENPNVPKPEGTKTGTYEGTKTGTYEGTKTGTYEGTKNGTRTRIDKEENKEVMCAPSGAPQPPEMSDDEIADLLDSVPQGKGSPFPEKGSPISSAPKHRTTTPRKKPATRCPFGPDASIPPEFDSVPQGKGSPFPEKGSPISSAPKHRTTTPRKKPATRCPFGPDASIPPEYLEIAQKAGIGDPQQVFSAFVNHAIAHDRSLVVWPAGFRTWCSNELRYHPNQTPKPKPLHQRTAADYDW